MNKMDVLADYVGADVNVDLKDSQIFVYLMPQEIEVGAVFLGRIYGTPVDPELPGFRDTTFQVVVRHTNVLEGEEIMNQVINSLTMVETQLTGLYVKEIRPLHDPVVFPVSKGDHLEINTTFKAVYVLN